VKRKPHGNGPPAIDEYEYQQARERGEEVVGVHYMHSLRMKEEEGGVTLHSVTVRGRVLEVKTVRGEMREEKK
jgi:hypothetical protein